VPLQQQQQQRQSNPAAGASLSSAAAAFTAGRDLQIFGKSAMQQHPQPQQHCTVYQQVADQQMKSVCIYFDQLLASLYSKFFFDAN
jgi:hypothetical protein